MSTSATLLDHLPLPAPANVATTFAAFTTQWRPRERPPLSVWAERNIILSSEYAARASRLRLFGWQREIFDSFTDAGTNEITIACSTQTVKTLFIQCAMAYAIVEDQGPILIVQPKQDDARAFSKERLGPMIRDCPALRGLISDSEKEGNTILNKEFPGGSVAIVGAISPGNLARRSIRYVFFDEVDKYPASAGKEGDPVTLGRERTITFGIRRKIIHTCSPTVAGRSRILKAYADSDQRKPYVACHACGHRQVMNFRTSVKFDTTVSSELQHTTAYYQCSNKDCGVRWTDLQRWAACEQVEWRASKPFQGHAGFWINHLYSPFKTISEIVRNFLNAKDVPTELQAFVNTNLAEAWEEAGSAPDPEVLYGRREDYPHTDNAIIPLRGLFLTAAVDVQDSPPRLEVEVKAWGRKRENWSIGYWVIQAQTSDGEMLPVTHVDLWNKLDQEILQSLYLHATGHHLPIMCMCIDTGSRPKPVYDFALRHARLAFGPAGAKLAAIRTVVPIKGNDDQLRIISGVSKENQAVKRQNIRIVSVGTHCAKQEFFDLLKNVRPPADGTAQAGCYHFPYYTLDYFQMLASEYRYVDPDTGDVEYRKKPNTRNEGLDLNIYNRAAAALVGIDRFTEVHWRKLEMALGIQPPLATVLDPTNPSPPAQAPTTGEVAEALNEALKPENMTKIANMSQNAPQTSQNAPQGAKNPPIPLPAPPATAPHLQSASGDPAALNTPHGSSLGRGRRIRGRF